MELIKHDHYAVLKVDSPDNDKDIIELGLACRDYLLDHQVLVLKKQNPDSVYYSKLIHSMTKNGIYNWRQCSWTPDGELFSMGEQLMANVGYTSKEAANVAAANMPKSGPLNQIKPTSSLQDKNHEYLDPFNFTEPNSYPVQRVTGEQKGKYGGGIFGTGDLDWHCNLGGYHEADGVALQGIRDVEGASTFFANSVPALRDMSDNLREQIENRKAHFKFDHKKWSDTTKMHPMQRITMQLLYLNNKRAEMDLYIIQQNLKGIKGIYFHRLNNMKIEGDDGSLVQALYEHMFQEQYVYEHKWEVGDIILMDQLITQHKREFVEPSLLEKRVLHRLTFMLNNDDDYVYKYNHT